MWARESPPRLLPPRAPGLTGYASLRRYLHLVDKSLFYSSGRPISPSHLANIKMAVVSKAHWQSHLTEDILPGTLLWIRGSN